MNENNKELFWDATIEEVKRGFIEYGESYKCIICEEEFTKGRIYEIDSMLYDAKKATELHIEKSHGSSLEYLLGMNSTFTGISEVQRELLVLIASGLTDKEIALKIGVAHSTIRNHRFKLREKEKQARLFLAMMEIISSGTKKKIKILEKEALCDAHKTATILDDRYNITDKERESIIKNYMDENGAVKTYPAKEKKKIIVLAEIVKNFSKGRKYSEKEINSMLKRIYEDYATIRRALIEYGFIERTNDCSSYWIKE
ncbi:DUF2087 domain-containing protein [Clostridium gasigenes]|uniref:DUF2087 domain-containing protein n=1 Tax=Clostridium gasigenes TaxID=94869 RepID=A0A7X0SCW1_9CLOT|nr:DUF2087 domain-containing protein [Clostridium gasigenes]MBB6713276.1 DUF2087 domain-containing protein [Clostridium gasigenes]